MPQVVAGKVWNNDRLPSLFFGIYHFFRIVILQNPFDCSVDCLRIMDITEKVTENEARHTIIGTVRIPASVFGSDTANSDFRVLFPSLA